MPNDQNIFMTKPEAKAVAKDPMNWLDAMHWGMNQVLENRDTTRAAAAAAAGRKIPQRTLLTKLLGTPLELLKVAGESAYIASSDERMSKNRDGMHKLAETSIMNRLLSGYTNTAQNIIGGAQLQMDYVQSRDAAGIAGVNADNYWARRAMAAENKKAEEIINARDRVLPTLAQTPSMDTLDYRARSLPRRSQ